jgi:hypothetical protein
MAGNQVTYGANKFESGLSAVSLRPCGPLALIPVNGEKNEIRGKIRTKKMIAVRDPGVAGW